MSFESEIVQIFSIENFLSSDKKELTLKESLITLKEYIEDQDEHQWIPEECWKKYGIKRTGKLTSLERMREFLLKKDEISPWSKNDILISLDEDFDLSEDQFSLDCGSRYRGENSAKSFPMSELDQILTPEPVPIRMIGVRTVKELPYSPRYIHKLIADRCAPEYENGATYPTLYRLTEELIDSMIQEICRKDNSEWDEKEALELLGDLKISINWQKSIVYYRYLG